MWKVCAFMSRPNRRTLVSGVGIFILLPLLIGVLMYVRMMNVMHTSMENDVRAQADILNQVAADRLSFRLTEMERVSEYFEDGRVTEEDMGSVVEGLLRNQGQTSSGILRLDGTPVSGDALMLAEYTAVRDTFRGKSAVHYRIGEGLLLTTPIYNNGNVKYALYEFFDQMELFQGFAATSFNGSASFMLADSSERIIIPISQDTEYTESDPFFSDVSVQAAISKLSEEMNIASTAAVYFRAGGDKYFMSVSDLGQSGLYLVGIMPYDAVANNIESLTGMTVAVFALLLILLLIGMIRLINADTRARESDELRRAKQIAEDASESKGKFLSSMSHELRTPINTIMGMDEMILRETEEPSTREKAIDIRSASQILLGLINDVLDFAKIESGKLTLVPVDYSVVTLIRDLVLLSENRARSKSLYFKLDIAPDLPMGLYGDDIRIQQIITNLLTNAVKYTQKGVVTLRMSSMPGPEENSIILHCEVADTGIGIKPEDMDKLMRLSPFTRVDEGRNRHVEGSGLGLPIIINLLKLMGSELQIESEYGKGSTFSFDLTQRVTNAEPVGDIKSRIANRNKEYIYHAKCYAPDAKVLVVDDNAMNRKIFTGLMAPTKIRVSEASSGMQCLEMVRRERYDLIFLDYLMPEMDAEETMRHMNEMDDNLCADTPIIALTANVFSGAQEKYLEMGFDAYLAKPIVVDKLESVLVEMLPAELLQTPPTDTPAPARQTNSADGLPVIEGVNWEYALLHISDRDLLFNTLKDFYWAIDGEKEELQALSRALDSDGGFDAFRIRVHSLKSTAATVGLLSVSEIARLLESAAVERDADMVRVLEPVLLTLLDDAREHISPYVREEEPREPSADTSKLAALLDMLRFELEEMDTSAIDMVMGEINSFAFPREYRDDLDRLSAQTAAFDFGSAAATVDRILENLRGTDGD